MTDKEQIEEWQQYLDYLKGEARKKAAKDAAITMLRYDRHLWPILSMMFLGRMEEGAR